MKIISKKKFMDLGNRKTVIRAMRDSVKFCHKRRHYVALLCLISCYIDGLNNGSKRKYIKILRKHFPALCKKLHPSKFYDKYRSGIVHNFKPKGEYALVENHEVNGKYCEDIRVEGINRKYKGLNMDRFMKDFLKYLDFEENIL